MLQDHFSHDEVFVCGVASFTDRCIIVVACYLRFVDFRDVGTCMRKTLFVRRSSLRGHEEEGEEEIEVKFSIFLSDITKIWGGKETTTTEMSDSFSV